MEPEEKRIEGTHVKKSTDASKQVTCYGLANDVRECLKYLTTELRQFYQCPIVIAIFLEGFFSCMEELKDCLGRNRLLVSGKRGGLTEVCATK